MFASVKEGLPYALMEAMAAELPVIATKVGGIPDLILHSHNGILTKAKNPHALKEELAHIIAHPEHARDMAKKAKETITTHHSLDTMIKETINLYHEITQPYK